MRPPSWIQDILCYNELMSSHSANGVAGMLKAGQTAPDFELPDADMEVVTLASFRHRKHVVLFFYPRDDTPSCTLEALEFSDKQDEFERLGAVTLGVSMDDCESHVAFRDKHGLSVQLLADVDGEACRGYGVLEEVDRDGIRRDCIRRSTFVINKQGMIAHALYGISSRGHVAEVLKLLKGMAKCK